MGLLTRLAKRASAAFPVFVGGLFGGESASPPNNQTEYLQKYGVDPWTYACVWAIASTASQYEPVIIDKNTKKEVDNKALSRLLSSPNPDMDWYDFMEASLIYLELAGEVFWEKVYDGNHEIIEIYPLRPDRVSIVVAEDQKKISQYVYEVGNKNVSFYPEQITHVKYFNPVDDWRGQGTTHSLVNYYVWGQNINRWGNRTTSRFGAAEGFLSSDQVIGEQEAERIARKWREGGDDPSKTPLLPKGLKWNATTTEKEKDTLLQLMKQTQDGTFAVTGVPPAKVGLMEHARYTQYDIQHRAFVQNAIMPRLKKVLGSLRRGVISEFDENYVPAIEAYHGMYANLSEFVVVLGELFDRDGLTINELIELSGFGKKFSEGNKRRTEITKERGGTGDISKPDQSGDIDRNPNTPAANTGDDNQ